MSTTPAPTAPPVPGATEQSTQQPAGDVPLDANGQPLTKSALKRLQKEKDLAAKKALKQAQNQGKPAPAAQAGEGKKKEKPAKKEEVVEEPPYGETQDGDKKGASALTPRYLRIRARWRSLDQARELADYDRG